MIFIYRIYEYLVMSENPISINNIRYLDSITIPLILKDAVKNRNYNQLIEIYKRNQLLTRKIISFYYQQLAVSANFRSNNKSGISYTVPWYTVYEKEKNNKLILCFDQQVNLYKWITINRNNSDLGFMIFSLGNYLTQLRTAKRILNQKQNACCFYKLGIDIKNNQELDLFIRKFIY